MEQLSIKYSVYGDNMTKYKIVTMPGDGIGKVVLPETLKVLDAVEFDAEYIH